MLVIAMKLRFYLRNKRRHIRHGLTPIKCRRIKELIISRKLGHELNFVKHLSDD
ncbi:unnamed protein product [Angiostrongylus costaricensis]|uniref:Transposase n=1 Tax=Angiostrongylus costaricensis TaxID=334426 RepID=A0A0R3PIS3_ANGCS|nr:unnamed protein product [Angiostrongylus costaricensis]